MNKEYEFYMKKALYLARFGRTSPNPKVGAVIVKNGEVISQGFHTAVGKPHAEVEAITMSKKDVRGSTLFVNLEPCSHFGRTPPCTGAIIKAGIKEVVIAMHDPNPIVCGNGIKILMEAGISVVTDVLNAEAKKLNEIFIKYITLKKPFVIMKSAITLDGKIATYFGDSKWVTGDSAREHVHTIRNNMSSIMVGINTVLCDDPSLTTRLKSNASHNPIPIIVDSKGQIPIDSKVLSLCNKKLILATTSKINKEKETLLLEKGVHIVKCGDERVDLTKLMDELYKLEIDSVLLEGGGTLNASALQSEIVDKVMYYIAPKIIGGKNAITSVEGSGIPIMNDAINLTDIKVKKLGQDILIEGYINKNR